MFAAAIREVIRSIVRGLAFWFTLAGTTYFMYLGIEIPSWWVAFLTLMAKSYYDEEKRNGILQPALAPEVPK